VIEGFMSDASAQNSSELSAKEVRRGIITRWVWIDIAFT
jgi:hypothetical protein